MGIDVVFLSLGIAAISCFTGVAGYFMRKNTQELEAARILATQMALLSTKIEYMGQALQEFTHTVSHLDGRVQALEVTTAIHEEKINAR